MVTSLYQKFRRAIDEEGMLVTSTGFLANAMLRDIDFSRPLKILEMGSGKGPMTREILRRMSSDSTLDICEIKADYNPWIERLMQAHPDKQATLYNECATDFLEPEDRQYDVIISSLPLRTFERADGGAFMNRVLECFRNRLRENGVYAQYQYFMSNKDDIERVFDRPVDRIRFVPLNLPPAFVYHLTNDGNP